MSESPLKQQITEAMKAAMRAKDKPRLTAVRLILAEIKKVEVDERIDPDDARITSILDKMVKQRRDSIKQYLDAGREELAATEQAEIDVIQEFLPSQLSEAEIEAIVQEAVASTGAASMQDMGKVMGQVKPQVVGRADMGMVSQKVKAALA
ncbi:MAG: GatB/YqeY domain-containing protein [Pseudomonadales bacterium]|nr:GatB/YqeY domain-containing protein [Pseudomonadales bacterium]